jgi:2-amino-4-hydroxy-6-hydroxymethyldihydropteridine diphosphokinase
MLTYLSLGSNRGSRACNLSLATIRLALTPGVDLLRLSSVYETAPWGDEDQPPFLNLVLAVRTTLGPHELLRQAKAIEALLGRTPTRHWGPRAIDIDILLFGELQIATPDLTIPHPHLAERQFVLVPLAEIAPDHALAPGITVRALAQPNCADMRRLGHLAQAMRATA